MCASPCSNSELLCHNPPVIAQMIAVVPEEDDIRVAPKVQARDPAERERGLKKKKVSLRTTLGASG